MAALVVVVIHELDDLPLQIFRRIVILQVHYILLREVITFDLAQGHRMIGSSVGVFDVPAVQVIIQILLIITHFSPTVFIQYFAGHIIQLF